MGGAADYAKESLYEGALPLYADFFRSAAATLRHWLPLQSDKALSSDASLWRKDALEWKARTDRRTLILTCATGTGKSTKFLKHLDGKDTAALCYRRALKGELQGLLPNSRILGSVGFAKDIWDSDRKAAQAQEAALEAGLSANEAAEMANEAVPEILIIDEMESLLEEMTARHTHLARGIDVRQAMINLIEKARAVVMADAHASPSLVRFVREIRGHEPEIWGADAKSVISGKPVIACFPDMKAGAAKEVLNNPAAGRYKGNYACATGGKVSCAMALLSYAGHDTNEIVCNTNALSASAIESMAFTKGNNRHIALYAGISAGNNLMAPLAGYFADQCNDAGGAQSFRTANQIAQSAARARDCLLYGLCLPSLTRGAEPDESDLESLVSADTKKKLKEKNPFAPKLTETNRKLLTDIRRERAEMLPIMGAVLLLLRAGADLQWRMPARNADGEWRKESAAKLKSVWSGVKKQCAEAMGNGDKIILLPQDKAEIQQQIFSFSKRGNEGKLYAAVFAEESDKWTNGAISEGYSPPPLSAVYWRQRGERRGGAGE